MICNMRRLTGGYGLDSVIWRSCATGKIRSAGARSPFKNFAGHFWESRSGVGIRLAGAASQPLSTHSSPTFSYARFTAAQAMRKAASSWRGSRAWAKQAGLKTSRTIVWACGADAPEL
jgi:hypothetical protein